jgi:molecular chaperone DnaK
VLQRTQEIAQRAVERVEELTWDQIDQVILVGGQTLMPAIQRSVEELSGRKPRALDWPQQAVARGAAEYAHILSLTGQESQDYALSHVIALPLGVRIDENTFKPIVQANKTVPHRSEPLTVTTTEDGQTYIIVQILQQPWGAKTADACVLLGDVRMDVLPAPKGSYNFTVEFNVLEDATMSVIVAYPYLGQSKELDIIEHKTTTWRDATKKRGG